MARSVAIMTYGTPKDRMRAAAIAKLHGKSTSEWLLQLIRDQFVSVYGDVDPESFNVQSVQRSSS